MPVLKYKDPVTGEVKKVGSPASVTVEQLEASENDNGKILMVVDGKATWVSLDNAEGEEF